MITADEARKIASVEDKRISEQLEEIEKYVLEAALNGFYAVTTAGQMHQYVKSYLEQLGYDIVIFDDSYAINWVQ